MIRTRIFHLTDTSIHILLFINGVATLIPTEIGIAIALITTGLMFLLIIKSRPKPTLNCFWNQLKIRIVSGVRLE